MQFKRNQVEEAIFRTFGANDEQRRNELKLRAKRLLVTDRRMGRYLKSANEEDLHYAFFGEEPPGSGTEIMFSAYEAFALLSALILLEHGFPQARAVRILRLVRRSFEAAHSFILSKDPAKLFDKNAVYANASPGMMYVDNTDPVFLAFVGTTAPSINEETGSTPAAVCQGQAELQSFIKQHAGPGTGATFFELVGVMHKLKINLSQTRPVKRGRGAM